MSDNSTIKEMTVRYLYKGIFGDEIFVTIHEIHDCPILKNTYSIMNKIDGFSYYSVQFINKKEYDALQKDGFIRSEETYSGLYQPWSITKILKPKFLI